MVGFFFLFDVYKFVKVLKEQVKFFIYFYIYYIIGFGLMIYLKVIEVGVDGIDMVLFLFVLGIFQLLIEIIVYVFENIEYVLKFDLEKINEVSEYFKVFREEYIRKGFFDLKVLSVDINVFYY